MRVEKQGAAEFCSLFRSRAVIMGAAPDHSSEARRSHRRRKISGLFSSFLDAFSCHAAREDRNLCRKEKIKEDAPGRVSLRQRMLKKKPDEHQETKRIRCGTDPVPKCFKEEVQEQQGEEEKNLKKKLKTDSNLSNRVRWIVKQLQFGSLEQQERAASLVRKTSRDSAESRVEFAQHGTIPLLVSVLESSSSSSKAQISSLFALLNLAIANNRNKEAIVAAGAIPSIVKFLSSSSSSQEQIESATAALLSLSALDSNKPIIGHSGVIPHLFRVLQPGGGCSNQAVKDCIRVIYNLSLAPTNAPALAAHTDALIKQLHTSDSDDKLLAILGNLVESSESARQSADASIDKLLDALRFYTANLETPSPSSSCSSGDDFFCSSSSSRDSKAAHSVVVVEYPGEYASGGKTKADDSVCRCQERVLYILMVVSLHSCAARKKMLSSGAITPLLEATLLGSAIAQKRAARILDCLREDRLQRNGRPVSAPLSISLTARLHHHHYHQQQQQQQQQLMIDRKDGFCEERKAVNLMVRQSLQMNMEKMVRRARLQSVDLDRSCSSQQLMLNFGSMSSSKSLPD